MALSLSCFTSAGYVIETHWNMQISHGGQDECSVKIKKQLIKKMGIHVPNVKLGVAKSFSVERRDNFIPKAVFCFSVHL